LEIALGPGEPFVVRPLVILPLGDGEQLYERRRSSPFRARHSWATSVPETADLVSIPREFAGVTGEPTALPALRFPACPRSAPA
jgi:hypothetical protein